MAVNRPKSLWRRVAVLVGVAVVLCAAGGGLSLFVINNHQKALEQQPKAATQAFLNDLQTSSAAQAFTMLCSTTKQSFTVADLKPVQSYQIVDVTVNTVDNVPSAIVTADITRGGGSVERHSIPLSKENGRWLICGEPY